MPFSEFDSSEYPGASIIPARNFGYGVGVKPKYKAFCVHTPEEPADDYETTPVWFQDPRSTSSTIFYLDNDGDIIQMVKFEDIAWAQGTRSIDLHWKGDIGTLPVWAEDNNLNLYAVSCEVEGYAATIHRTMPVGGIQWNQLVAMIKWCSVPRPELYLEGYPLDREHVFGHDEINLGKGDPGTRFEWDKLMYDLNTNYTNEDVQTSLDEIRNQISNIERLLG